MGKKEEPDVQVTREWERPDPLKVEGKDPGKAYRWIDKKKLEQRRYEGWTPCRDEGVVHKNPDGTPDSGSKEYRELILCEMPQERADSRNKFYLKKAEIAGEAPRKVYEQHARRMGVDTRL